MAQFKKKTSARYLVAKIDLRNIKPMSAVWSQCLTCGFGWKVLVSFGNALFTSATETKSQCRKQILT